MKLKKDQRTIEGLKNENVYFKEMLHLEKDKTRKLKCCLDTIRRVCLANI